MAMPSDMEMASKMVNSVDLSGYVILLVEVDDGRIKLYGK
jgi:hypothetical protein